MSATEDDLLTLLLESYRGGQYGPGYDPATFAKYSTGSPYSEPDNVGSIPFGGGGGGGGDPMDEVLVESTKPKPPPPPPKAFVPPALPPSLISTAIETATTLGSAVLTGIGALLFPTPTAPREMDEAPGPMLELDIGGKRPPKLPSILPPFDAPLPPNWNDLVHGYNFYIDQILFPLPGGFREDLGFRQQPRDSRPPRIGDDVDGLDEVEISAPRSKPLPAPKPAPTPDIRFNPIGDPLGLPFGDPGVESSPSLEPQRQPVPIRRPSPIGAPYANPFAFPGPAADPLWYASPAFDPFEDPRAEPLRPREPMPLPPGTAPSFPRPSPVPPSFLDPVNEGPSLDPLAAPPMTEKPNGADTCNCAPTGKKKPKKKDPRRVCYRGTYTETSKSLKKSPKEQVPCQ